MSYQRPKMSPYQEKILRATAKSSIVQRLDAYGTEKQLRKDYQNARTVEACDAGIAKCEKNIRMTQRRINGTAILNKKPLYAQKAMCEKYKALFEKKKAALSQATEGFFRKHSAHKSKPKTYSGDEIRQVLSSLAAINQKYQNSLPKRLIVEFPTTVDAMIELGEFAGREITDDDTYYDTTLAVVDPKMSSRMSSIYKEWSTITSDISRETDADGNTIYRVSFHKNPGGTASVESFIDWCDKMIL